MELYVHTQKKLYANVHVSITGILHFQKAHYDTTSFLQKIYIRTCFTNQNKSKEEFCFYKNTLAKLM